MSPMALIVLTSASGSSGVTTSARGLVQFWPRPSLLVEADPTEGSGALAGFFHGDVAHIWRPDRPGPGSPGGHPGRRQRQRHHGDPGHGGAAPAGHPQPLSGPKPHPPTVMVGVACQVNAMLRQ